MSIVGLGCQIALPIYNKGDTIYSTESNLSNI